MPDAMVAMIPDVGLVCSELQIIVEYLVPPKILALGEGTIFPSRIIVEQRPDFAEPVRRDEIVYSTIQHVATKPVPIDQNLGIPARTLDTPGVL